jgi:hypothetical protein
LIRARNQLFRRRDLLRLARSKLILMQVPVKPAAEDRQFVSELGTSRLHPWEHRHDIGDRVADNRFHLSET